MSHRPHMVEAQIARRRELENDRCVQSAAVNRYFDHWGKVTTRYQNWTKPEYYEQADALLKQSQEKKAKAKQLDERREKLRQLFADEAIAHEQEIRQRQKSKTKFSRKSSRADTETLEKIEQLTRERENNKRKLELEAKLYGRWRHGVEDANLIFESKNDHQVLAKLNWLDKQIDDQMQREKEESEALERNLRLQEERRRTEELQKEREALRAEEMEKMKSLQEQHMRALKSHQEETEHLKGAENHVRNQLGELRNELELLQENAAYIREPVEFAQAFNLKKIKVFIRQRSDTYRNQIKLYINVLERMQPYCVQQSNIEDLIKKYRDQLEVETLAVAQFEAMYESEAKYNLQRCEVEWQQQQNQRYSELKKLLDMEIAMLNNRLQQNMERQSEIIELRSAHITAIEAANDQLKQLAVTLCETSDGGADASSAVLPFVGAPRSKLRSLNTGGHLTNTFSNLNLDQCSDEVSANSLTIGHSTENGNSLRSVMRHDYNNHQEYGGQEPTPSEASSQISAASSTTTVSSARPEFGRKRVVWT